MNLAKQLYSYANLLLPYRVTRLIHISFVLAKLQRKKLPKLFWVSAIAPFMVVVIGGVFAFLVKGDEHGIPIVSQSSMPRRFKLQRNINIFFFCFPDNMR